MVSRFLLLALPAALACGKDAAHPPVATGSAAVGGSAAGAGTAAGPAPGACQPLPFAATTPVPEASAVRGDVFYRMSDTGGGPSLMAAFRCAH